MQGTLDSKEHFEQLALKKYEIKKIPQINLERLEFIKIKHLPELSLKTQLYLHYQRVVHQNRFQNNKSLPNSSEKLLPMPLLPINPNTNHSTSKYEEEKGKKYGKTLQSLASNKDYQIECYFCLEQLTQPSNLSAHMRSHTGEKLLKNYFIESQKRLRRTSGSENDPNDKKTLRRKNKKRKKIGCGSSSSVISNTSTEICCIHEQPNNKGSKEFLCAKCPVHLNKLLTSNDCSLHQIPTLFGFTRITRLDEKSSTVLYLLPTWSESKKHIACNIKELHEFLLLEGMNLPINCFSFNPNINPALRFIPNPEWKKEFYLNDFSKGVETLPIPVVSYQKKQKLEPLTEYIGDFDLIPAAHEIKNDKEIPGISVDCVNCSCTDDCQDKLKCSCFQETLKHASKDVQKRLLLSQGGLQYRTLMPSDRILSPIFQCSPKCKCRSTCVRKITGEGMQWRLEIFRTGEKGWGVRSLQDIPMGSFLMTYTGSLYHHKNPKLYYKYASPVPMSYLLDLSYDSAMFKRKSYKYVANARDKGNLARFLNSSCDPNCFPQALIGDERNLFIPQVGFFASKDISPGDELTWDYCYPSKFNVYCKCGAENCSKLLYGNRR